MGKFTEYYGCCIFYHHWNSANENQVPEGWQLLGIASGLGMRRKRFDGGAVNSHI